MRDLPTLDAHAHLSAARTSRELADSGAVLAMTCSLDQAVRVASRTEPWVVWGVGCHPRYAGAQELFDPHLFRRLAERSPVIGEVGLDTGSKVPLDVQQRTFRQALAIAKELGKPVSIHSYDATGPVLEVLRDIRVAAPILHWWTGTADDTRRAVELGCYFSVHSQVARRSVFRTIVPPERLLIESDHGFLDPPAAIPCRVQWVEHLVAQQLRATVQETRHLVWHNLGRILRETGTLRMLPRPFATVFDGFVSEAPPRFSRVRKRQEPLWTEC